MLADNLMTDIPINPIGMEHFQPIVVVEHCLNTVFENEIEVKQQKRLIELVEMKLIQNQFDLKPNLRKSRLWYCITSTDEENCLGGPVNSTLKLAGEYDCEVFTCGPLENYKLPKYYFELVVLKVFVKIDHSTVLQPEIVTYCSMMYYVDHFVVVLEERHNFVLDALVQIENYSFLDQLK
ncbi:hypothetical protein AGLY_017918 [Aphis glycines]|uniref:Uncharacterized protein n=1 Tax=Aphis glycines TaxID=307491 RepID=A0A6G0SUA8_APHGL|nr:hypothetical protein AGLY_017918 [Aphis glycines]